MSCFTRVCFIIGLFFCFSLLYSQENETISWKGVVVNGSTGEPVPNAVLAVFSQVSMYSTDDNGAFRIALLPTDSVRVLAMGFKASTYLVRNMPESPEGVVTLTLNQVSYSLKGITVKGYKGLLDPLIFPEFEDGTPKIDLFLPSNIGSKMSIIPPQERLLMEKPSVLAAVVSPVSFAYSVFSKREKSLINLVEAKAKDKEWEKNNTYADRETIAVLSGFEGEELDAFVIYCNVNLKIGSYDNGASVAAKIKTLLEKFKDLQHKNDLIQ